MAHQKMPPPLAELQSCDDFENAARECLPAFSWEYISGGEADTIERNRHDFGTFLLRPRVLRDVSEVNLGCKLFGEDCEIPLYLSSVAKAGLVAADGEASFVRCANRAKTAYLVPIVSSLPTPEIWAACSPRQRLPFQFYFFGDDSFQRLREAVALGASAVIVTVDANAPRAGSFSSSTALATGAVGPVPQVTWAHLEEVRKVLPANMPLYLKGVQTAEDALQATRVGVQGIIVSNHGGRCCSQAWGGLSALEDVSRALWQAGMLKEGTSPGVELYYDSGVRSGRDALKALCLGARGVGLGRPYYWAAACHGEEGVMALLEMLVVELRHAMAQAGVSSLRALGPSMLCRFTSRPQVLDWGANGCMAAKL